MSQPKLSKEQIESILSQVKFMDRQFTLLEKGDGYLVQMSYLEADVFHPEKGPMLQKTRKWYVSPFSTESEIVETCWAAACRSQLHIASEHFKYKDRQVYTQHFDIDARIKMYDEFQLDGRIPIAD